MEKEIPARLAALAHPQRLALFRLLMRRYPDRVPAGELAAALGQKASTLSAWLSALSQAGLVTHERVGTSLRYAMHMDEVQRTFDYLLRDCCRGRPDLCLSLPAFVPDPAPELRRAFRVLFVCTGNSARSLMAEAILRRDGGARFEVHSAGTHPRDAADPRALAVLRRNGHDVTALRPKSLSGFRGDGAPAFDFVFTVCDRAANEECPAWPGQPVGAHWGIPAPAAAATPGADADLAFERAHDALRARIGAFVALPLDTLNPVALQRAVDGIAFTPEGHDA